MGGPAQTICDAPRGSDGSWNADGVILFDGRTNDPIWRVPASGGIAKVEVAENPAKGITNPGWPEFLPDGRHYLFTRDLGGAQELVVGLLDSQDVTPLFKVGSRVEYAEPGYLLFVRENTLVAQKFNAGTLKVEGDATPIGEGLGVDAVGLASFSVSRNGVLAFREGELGGRRLVWMDRAGKEAPAIDGISDFRDTSFSPDGKRLAFDAGSSASSDDIWIRDFARGVTERFTFDPAIEQTPVWSPDGRQIAYTTRAKGRGDLYVKDASGAKDAQLLFQDADFKLATDWSRDGKYLLYSAQAAGSFDIYALPMTGTDRKPFPVVKTEFIEYSATFSPDSRYIAYSSNASGRMEIYVQEFPEAKSRVQVSTNGGTEPFWRADGTELFYRAGRTHHVRARAAHAVVFGRAAGAGPSDDVRVRHLARPLPSHGGRPALSARRAAWTRLHEARVDRAELDGRAANQVAVAVALCIHLAVAMNVTMCASRVQGRSVVTANPACSSRDTSSRYGNARCVPRRTSTAPSRMNVYSMSSRLRAASYTFSTSRWMSPTFHHGLAWRWPRMFSRTIGVSSTKRPPGRSARRTAPRNAALPSSSR